MLKTCYQDIYVDSLIEKLLVWNDENRRILPWREDPSPYHVWLSEIMLQQTRVEAVRGYYARFLAAVPDIPSLAAAPDDVLLKLWQGLGYYSRVRNMKKAAAAVCEMYGGELPHTYEALVKLPGIGAYTAAAIASIAFGESVPAVDGNLIRIFSRLTAYGENARADTAKKAAFTFYSGALQTIASRSEALRSGVFHSEAGRNAQNVPGDSNQALMDLGATVCLPNGQPLCEKCPLAAECKAHAEGRETDYPALPPKKERRAEERTVLIIRYKEQVVLRKRPEKGLLAGLFEFPNAEGFLSEDEAVAFARSLGFHALRILPAPEAKHLFSHIEWKMKGYLIFADELCDDGKAAAADGMGATADGMDAAADGTDTATDGMAELRPHPAESPFLADLTALNERWSVPSAFSVYLQTARTILHP